MARHQGLQQGGTRHPGPPGVDVHAELDPDGASKVRKSPRPAVAPAPTAENTAPPDRSTTTAAVLTYAGRVSRARERATISSTDWTSTGATASHLRVNRKHPLVQGSANVAGTEESADAARYSAAGGKRSLWAALRRWGHATDRHDRRPPSLAPGAR